MGKQLGAREMQKHAELGRLRHLGSWVGRGPNQGSCSGARTAWAAYPALRSSHVHGTCRVHAVDAWGARGTRERAWGAREIGGTTRSTGVPILNFAKFARGRILDTLATAWGTSQRAVLIYPSLVAHDCAVCPQAAPKVGGN